MKVSKAFILALVTTVLACLAIACSAESQAVKIGLLSPQTGPIAQCDPRR